MNLELRHEPAREQAPLAEPDFARWLASPGQVPKTSATALTDSPATGPPEKT